MRKFEAQMLALAVFSAIVAVLAVIVAAVALGAMLA